MKTTRAPLGAFAADAPAAPRALIYARLSKDATGEGLNVAEQVERGHRLAGQRGWQAAGVHIDNDTSATSGRKRPGFEAVRATLLAGEAEVVIARDMDRLLRSGQDRLDMLRIGKDHGVMLAFWHGQDLDLGTVGGRMVADVLGAIAQSEIDAKAERQRLAAMRAARAGKRLGGRRPFGYGLPRSDGSIDYDTVVPGEAELIVEGYGSLLAGVPLAAIARVWNRHGTSPQGKAWRGSSVRDVLINARYAGLRAHGSVPERGRRRAEVVAPAAWPAIVPEATWQAAVAILRDPGRRNAPASATALLTGVALCGVCEATVHGGRASRGHHKVYRCSAAPGHVARKQDDPDAYVSELVVARMARPDAAGLAHPEPHQSVTRALSLQAASLRTRLDDLAALLADGSLSRVAVQAASVDLRAGLAAVEARQAQDGRTSALAPLQAARGDAEAVRAAWDGLDTDRQRVVIDTLMIVTLHPPGRGTRNFDPDSVEITWH
mgnify:CR=1 FL=1